MNAARASLVYKEMPVRVCVNTLDLLRLLTRAARKAAGFTSRPARSEPRP